MCLSLMSHISSCRQALKFSLTATGDVQQSHAAHLKKQLSADFSKKLDMFKQQTASPVTNKVCFPSCLHIKANMCLCQPLFEHALIPSQLHYRMTNRASTVVINTVQNLGMSQSLSWHLMAHKQQIVLELAELVLECPHDGFVQECVMMPGD